MLQRQHQQQDFYVENPMTAVTIPGNQQGEYHSEMPEQMRMFEQYLAHTIVQGLQQSNILLRQNRQNEGQRQLKRCYNCQKMGTHIARECRGRKQPRNEQNEGNRNDQIEKLNQRKSETASFDHQNEANRKKSPKNRKQNHINKR